MLLSCATCGQNECAQSDAPQPFCPAITTPESYFKEAIREFREDDQAAKVAYGAAMVQSHSHEALSRLESAALFAKSINAKRIGIATCAMFRNQTKRIARILTKKGFETYAVSCIVGFTDKSDIGLASLKKDICSFEPTCNPLIQARLLNEWGADLNVICGLCVGHDALFSKRSNALVTTLFTKDAIFDNNPLLALEADTPFAKRINSEEIYGWPESSS